MKANHQKTIRKLNIAKGQIEGIIKMIEDDRYCIDIYNQINATKAILAKVNNEIMEAHMKSCVKEAIINNDDSKIEEAFKAMSLNK